MYESENYLINLIMYITDIEQSIDKKTVVLMIDCLHTSMKLKKYHPDRKVPHTI
jgi:hypothetical protein